MTDYLTPIYTDVRQWIVSTLPDAVNDVIRAYQNGIAMPNNAIIMTFMMEKRLDQLSQTTDNGVATVFDSIQGTMQLDFYGPKAHSRARQVCTMWQTLFTADTLVNCQPLYCGDPKDLTFVNEAGQYELRFMAALELQYNNSYDVNVDTFIKNPNTELNNV